MAASVGAMLDLWSAAWREGKARLRPLFRHPGVAASAAAAFLDGLLGPERRKAGWMRAEAAGDPGPWRQQAVLGRGVGDAAAPRDGVRDHAVETLAPPAAVLVSDETGFLKQGQGLLRRGAPVHRLGGQDQRLPDRGVRRLRPRARPRPHRPPAPPAQGLGERSRAPGGRARAGRGGPRHRAGARGRADRAGHRRRRAVRPGGGRRRLRRGRDRGGAAPRGRGPRARRHGPAHRFWSRGKHPSVAGTAEEIAAAPPAAAWVRPSAGEGTKGPRLHDRAYLELADLAAAALGSEGPGVWTRGLLIRRAVADADLASFSTWCPAGTPVATPVAVEGRRWAIEDALEAAKAASSGSTATRPAPGTAGTATSRPSCRRSPCPPRSVTAPTARRPKKKN
jgi:hypothetical protein